MNCIYVFLVLSSSLSPYQIGNTAIQFVGGATKDQSATANKGHFVKKSFTSTLGSNANFQFNFPIDAMEKLSIEKQTETNGM